MNTNPSVSFEKKDSLEYNYRMGVDSYLSSFVIAKEGHVMLSINSSDIAIANNIDIDN